MPYKDKAKKLAAEKRWRASHKEKTRQYQAAWRLKNPDKMLAYNKSPRSFHLRRRYGIGTEDREAMLLAQGGGCALCGEQGRKLTIDHDHVTEKIRGLLCYNCNVGLGLFKDSEERLVAAIQYLRSNRS